MILKTEIKKIIYTIYIISFIYKFIKLQSSVKKKEMDGIWSKFKDVWKKYLDQGCTVIIAGNLNAAIGSSLGLTNNDEYKNRAGELLIEAV